MEEINYAIMFEEPSVSSLETSNKKYFLKNPWGFVKFMLKEGVTPGKYIKNGKEKLQIENIVKNLNIVSRKVQVKDVARKSNNKSDRA
jgi:hypothetical protein